MLVSHATFMTSSRRELGVRQRQTTITEGFARSGLTDALAWFKSQSAQPVVDFAPRRDPEAEPPVLETIDPGLGLVREFNVRGDLWGRYEVRHGETLDISATRGQPEEGTAWEVGARGILYQRNDPGVPFDHSPNRVVAMTTLKNEFRGVPVRPPALAAVAIERPADVKVRRNARIDGGAHPGVAHRPAGLAGLIGLLGGLLFGSPGSLGVPGYDDSPEQVFSMRLDQLRSFSDILAESVTDLPQLLPDNKVVFVGGNLTLPADRHQRGQGLIVIDGDLTALPQSDTEMSGIVYVNGDAYLRGPFAFKGMMVVRGKLDIGGDDDDVSITYDEQAVRDATRAAGQYRASRVVRPGGSGQELR